MPLAPGVRLGPYEIVAPIGAGGMGEVYRARDTRLGRDVAIKVLPQELSANAEVRARFEREARTISTLNHPHICMLFDVGRSSAEGGTGETDYLVMELLEGESLAQRLRRGALPSGELLKLGGQIADALDRAHRAGVIHRDLKPGNVMLTRGGAKLLDFGLARSAGMAGTASGSGSAAAALTRSPTVARQLTAEGTIVGTFQYMSPEQLEGGEADARSDVWALGATLYEMATGRPAFEGRSQASLIAAILRAEPTPVSQVVSGSGSMEAPPSALDRLIQNCLAKDPDDRIQTAHDVRLQLQWIADGGSVSSLPAPVTPLRRRRERLGWLVAGVLAAALAVVVGSALRSPAHTPPAARFEILAEPGQRNLRWPRVSPDGRFIAYQADDSLGITRIWLRALDAFVATPLAGTENANRPFWSPDSKWLAFTTGSDLKRIAVSGGPAQLIGNSHGGFDGAWGRRGVIVYDGGQSDSLRQMAADGGTSAPATRFDRAASEQYHAWPVFLPDGERFLFIAAPRTGTDDVLKEGRLGSLDSHAIGVVSSRVEFVPPDLVLYVQDKTLMARHVDLGAAKFVGAAFPVAEGAWTRGDEAHISGSPLGVVAFRSEASLVRSTLEWVDRSGRTIGEAAPPDQYREPSISPDGTRIAYGLFDPAANGVDLWVRDLKRNIATRLTFDTKNEVWPVWSPDGTRIAYSSNQSGVYSILVRDVSGAGPVDSLLHNGSPAGPTDWGRNVPDPLQFGMFDTGAQLWAMEPRPGAKPHPIQTNAFIEMNARLSPDGHWLAYQTSETGRPEIFVQACPGPGGKWRISDNGGGQPRWRGDGRELYYRTNDGTIVAVPIAVTNGAIDPGRPVALFQRVSPSPTPLRNQYDVSADGQRFLVNTLVGSGDGGGRIEVITSWSPEGRRR
ncbi:MAG TPA: protein kinase [Candidatus Acidoferrales bacterium]|nr:protein kinase [Candidatus Acidoferrales bacterium]